MYFLQLIEKRNKQAGLSRATLEISFVFSWYFPLTSIWGRLHFKHFLFWFGPLSVSLKFEEDPIRCCWDIQLLLFWGRLPFEVVFISSIFILVWSPELKFKIGGRSSQWLLIYLTFDILWSSSIWGQLHIEYF